MSEESKSGVFVTRVLKNETLGGYVRAVIGTVITLMVAGIGFYTTVNYHISNPDIHLDPTHVGDSNLHLTPEEKYHVQRISIEGFPFKESHASMVIENNHNIKLIIKDLHKIENDIMKVHDDFYNGVASGRFQSPKEKRRHILDTLDWYVRNKSKLPDNPLYPE